MPKYRTDANVDVTIGKGYCERFLTDYWHQFTHWFPEISPKLWTNFRIHSITIVVKRVEDNENVTFLYKVPKGGRI